MLIDSHCHLNLLDLSAFDNRLDTVLDLATEHDVNHFLSVCVELDDFPKLKDIADSYPHISISVGIHPNHEVEEIIPAQHLVDLALSHPACIAIGETGLDYYRQETTDNQHMQQQLFREHIRAAKIAKRPLIIHTRQAAEDTLRIMAEENASEIGGVMHCFSENWEIATRAMEQNFYISMSGIVTFKNALILQDVAKKVPLNRLLIETDSPYLAPVPYRGKQNHPALVKYVAQFISELRGISYEEVARATSENFQQCFRVKLND